VLGQQQAAFSVVNPFACTHRKVFQGAQFRLIVLVNWEQSHSTAVTSFIVAFYASYNQLEIMPLQRQLQLI
jgi:hypothetical protein